METRSNNVFVGAIVLLLLAITIGGAFWFARVGEGNKHEYISSSNSRWEDWRRAAP
jgi:ABC-type transporter Mla subunit MlaD